MKNLTFLQILGLIAGNNQKQVPSKNKVIPTGILEVYPKIVYTPKIKISFDNLENAMKRYNVRSQRTFNRKSVA